MKSPPKKKDLVLRLHNKGLKAEDIAEVLDADLHYVLTVLVDHGVLTMNEYLKRTESPLPLPTGKYLSHQRRRDILERAEVEKNTDALALLDHIEDREQVNARAVRSMMDILHQEVVAAESARDAALNESNALRENYRQLAEALNNAILVLRRQWPS